MKASCLPPFTILRNSRGVQCETLHNLPHGDAENSTYLSAEKPLVQFQNSAHNSRFHLSLPYLARFFPEMRPCPRIRMVLVPYFDYCTIITQYYYASGAHLAVYLLQCTLPQNSRFGRNLCEIAALAQCMARTARAATRFTLAAENYNSKIIAASKRFMNAWGFR